MCVPKRYAATVYPTTTMFPRIAFFYGARPALSTRISAARRRALFDYLYLRPLPADLEPQRYNLAEDLRLNLEELTLGEQEEFVGFVFMSKTSRKGGAKMRHVQNNLEVNVWLR